MHGYALLYPEYILTALGLLILVVDWFTPLKSKRNLAWLGVGGLVLALVATALVATTSPTQRQLPGWAASQLEVDFFAAFFKIIIITATILVLLASPDYVEKRIGHAQGEFYALLIFAGLGMSLMAASKDLISLYLAMEFTSLTSYVLAGYQKSEPKSAEAGMKYFLIGVVSSGVMLYGISLIYGTTGTTSLDLIKANVTAAAHSNPLLLPALVLVTAGFGFKMALVPFHMWCPDTYEGAPTPFAAMLSVGPKAAGFAMMMRVFFKSFGALEAEWAYLLAIISAVTMTVGNLSALHQTNLKRMLAYSSIAQAGYMLIGLAATGGANPDWRYAGTLLYLFSYAFMNIGAFVCAIVLLDGSGTEEIKDCSNFIRRSPLTTIAFLIFLVSLAGLPPTAGFWAKALVFGAAIDSKMLWLGVVGWLNAVVAVYYYFNVIRYLFNFPPPQLQSSELVATPIQSSASLQVCLAACAAVTVIIGVYPGPFIELARTAGAIFGNG